MTVLAVLLASCGKDFLEEKQNARQTVPATVEDYQAILDYRTGMNGRASIGLGTLGADEFVIANGQLSTLTGAYMRNGYVWAQDVYEGEEVGDWNYAYQRILYANMALDVEKIENQDESWKNVKGSALFFRALNLYQLAQLFCKVYQPESAAKVPGIPTPITYDVTRRYGRGTLLSVYERMIQDLQEACVLLPEKAVNKFRPCKPAACALLARVYLQMENYQQALFYSEEGLKYQDALIDFNTLDLNARYTFALDYGAANPEVLFYSTATTMTIIATGRFNANPTLLASYAGNDLRKKAYFYNNSDGRKLFKGSYANSSYFAGLATDELWLTAAECRARLGNTGEAMNALNRLLSKRYDASFIPFSADNNEDALKIILKERQKELYMRGIRWEDLRRLNKDSRFSTALTREIDGKRYELPAGDPRWVWPVPDNEIQLNGLEQNER